VKPTPPTAVKLIRAKHGEATRSVMLPGQCSRFSRPHSSQVGGYGKTVAVDKGDAVKAGALLADLEVPNSSPDQTRYKAEAEIAALDYKRVTEAQKKAPRSHVVQSVDTAKSKSDIARANLERTETLPRFSQKSPRRSRV